MANENKMGYLPIKKLILQMSLPPMCSMFLQYSYNLVDSMFVANINENALAAVGNSYEITLIFIAFAFGCNIGCSVIVSRYFGAKEYHNVRTTVHTTLLSGAVLCALLMLLGFLGCHKMLMMIHTPEEIMADSRLYLMTAVPFLL